MLNSCSAATMVNHSFVTNSGETEVRIFTIEGHDYNISWDSRVNTNTDGKECTEFLSHGKHQHCPCHEQEHFSHQNTKKIKEGSITSTLKIAYGYRRTVGWLMTNTNLYFPVNNELYAE